MKAGFHLPTWYASGEDELAVKPLAPYKHALHSVVAVIGCPILEIIPEQLLSSYRGLCLRLISLISSERDACGDIPLQTLLYAAMRPH